MQSLDIITYIDEQQSLRQTAQILLVSVRNALKSLFLRFLRKKNVIVQQRPIYEKPIMFFKSSIIVECKWIHIILTW